MSNERGRIYGLDYIRAISAVLIILYHYTTQYDSSIGHMGGWTIQFPWGAWAVNTFFLLSGYLTLRSFKEGGWRFLYKRFVRLWPAFVVCVLITSSFMALMMPDRLRSLKDILLNFTMFPTYLGAKAVDGVYWTLPLEILFYVCFAVLMIKKLRPHLLKILYIWVALMVGISVLGFFGITPLPLKALRILLIAQRGECFIMGLVVALWQKHKKIVLIPLIVLCSVNSFLNMGIGPTIWTICFFVLILFLVYGNVKIFRERPRTLIGKAFVKFSEISYPIYLLHQYIGFAIIRQLEINGFVSQLWIFIPIAISLMLAFAVHYLVELPAAKVLLNFEKKISLRLKKGESQ